VVGLVLFGGLPVFGEIITGENDDGDVWISALYFPGEIEAALSWQSNVHKDEVRSKFIHLF